MVRENVFLNFLPGHPGTLTHMCLTQARQTYLEMMQELTIRNLGDPWRVERIQF